MAVSTVTLPQTRLASKRDGTELVLHGSISLCLPEQSVGITNGDELGRAVTDKHLWIARKGLCFLNVTFSVQREPVTSGDTMVQLAQWIENCAVRGDSGPSSRM